MHVKRRLKKEEGRRNSRDSVLTTSAKLENKLHFFVERGKPCSRQPQRPVAAYALVSLLLGSQIRSSWTPAMFQRLADRPCLMPILTPNIDPLLAQILCFLCQLVEHLGGSNMLIKDGTFTLSTLKVSDYNKLPAVVQYSRKVKGWMSHGDSLAFAKEVVPSDALEALTRTECASRVW